MTTSTFFRVLRSNILILSLAISVLGIVAFLGFVFFIQGRNLMERELHERLRSMASTSALMFDAEDLEQLRQPDDVFKPVYAKVVNRLIDIRSQSPDIKFLYILRPTTDPLVFEFVADADSLRPFAEMDLNQDGHLDESDELAPPGTPYDVSEIPHIQDGMVLPITLAEPYSDQWGTYISGFAPIKAQNGEIVAMLGVDIDIARYDDLSQRVISPVVLMLILLAGTLLTAFIVFVFWHGKVEEMRRIDEERSGLLRINFHQLGTPLTILKWSLEDIKSVAKKLKTKDMESSLADMEDGMNRIDAILQSLHEADKIHEGNIDYAPESVTLNHIVSRVSAEAEGRIKNKKQHFSLTLDSDAVIRSDPKLIEGVLRELFSNAVDFTQEDGTIDIRTENAPGIARVIIRDNGCGIPKKDLPRVFHEFARGSNAASMKPDGSGLGLYIAKGIVEKAGGTLEIESREKEGTTVTLSLPAA